MKKTSWRDCTPKSGLIYRSHCHTVSEARKSMNEEAIFLAALDTDPVQRAAFLDEACGRDLALRQGVETLLKQSGR
jgi:hypothetical protein